MEPHSKTDDTPDSRAILEGQLRECFGRVVYAHKTHEKAADILLTRLSRIKFSQIVLSALTTGGFIAGHLWCRECRGNFRSDCIDHPACFERLHKEL